MRCNVISDLRRLPDELSNDTELDAIRELKEKLDGKYEIVDDISRLCQ
jgi:hypothetical protein